MFSLATLIVTAAIALLIGGALGFALSGARSGAGRTAELEKRLADAERSLESYQRDVTEHFARTTELVNTLTESYRDVHEHLANSALKLTTPEIGRQILENASDNLPGAAHSELSEGQVEPPRDWAPKRAGQKGTLSEEYGFETHDSLDDEPSDEPQQASNR